MNPAVMNPNFYPVWTSLPINIVQIGSVGAFHKLYTCTGCFRCSLTPSKHFSANPATPETA